MGTKKYSVLATELLCGMLTTSIAFAEVPTAGDTAQTVPSAEDACNQIRAAADGSLVGKDGKSLTFTKSECANLPFRARNMPRCQTSGAELLKSGETADTLCARDRMSLNEDAASYCALREIGKDNQTAKYCDAYDSAERAQKGATLTFALDTVAAGVCWAEYKVLKRQLDLYIRTKNNAFDPKKHGVCAGASMAAGLGELVQTAKVLGGRNTTGNISIDSDGNPKDKKDADVTQIIDVAMSAGLSSIAIRTGVCQYWPQSFMCKKRSAKLEVKAADQLDESYGDTLATRTKTAAENVAKEELAKAEKDLLLAREKAAERQKEFSDAQAKLTDAKNRAGAAKEKVIATADPMEKAVAEAEYLKAKLELTENERAFDRAQTNLKLANSDVTIAQDKVHCSTDNLNSAQGKVVDLKADRQTDDVMRRAQARISVAYSSAIIFTTLAALRGGTVLLAKGTKKKAEDIIQSMFRSGDQGTNYGSAAYGGGGGAFAPPTSSGFTTPSTNQPNQNAAIAAGSPEAFILPPNAPHTAELKNLASQIPLSKAGEAAAGGAAGIGGLISSIGGASGDPSHAAEIRGVLNTAMSAFGKESDSYKGGGSARSLASKGESSPDLNLKGLFGGEGKEEQAAAEGELAYRGPASDDIWHSRNPKGNNLFQIISERYDTTQRSRSLSP